MQRVKTPPTWHRYKLSPSSPEVIKCLFATCPQTMTEKWSKPLSLRFHPLISFSVTVILTSLTVRECRNEPLHIEGAGEA